MASNRESQKRVLKWLRGESAELGDWLDRLVNRKIHFEDACAALESKELDVDRKAQKLAFLGGWRSQLGLRSILAEDPSGWSSVGTGVLCELWANRIRWAAWRARPQPMPVGGACLLVAWRTYGLLKR